MKWIAGAADKQISASSGAFSSTSGSDTDVTNLTVTITTTGRPVLIFLQSDGSGSVSRILVDADAQSAAEGIGYLRIVRGSTEIAEHEVRCEAGGLTYPKVSVPSSSIIHMDTPSAGTNTYKVTVKASNATVHISYAKLVAFEL
jgi:hypothetical protein